MDFSFSGVKTAVATLLATEHGRGERPEDLAASFQEAVVEMLVKPTIAAARELGADTIALTGGVAANSRLRDRLAEAAAADGRRLVAPGTEILHRQCGDDRARRSYQPDAWRDDGTRLASTRKPISRCEFVQVTTARKSHVETPSRSSTAFGAAGVRPGEIARAQNFLTSAGVARSNRRRAQRTSERESTSAVIEIGPGSAS